MALTIWEKASSRDVLVSPDGTAKLLYGVLGSEDETAVSALVEATIPALYLGLIYQSYRIKTEGGGFWEVEVQYGKRAPLKPGDLSSFGWQFDTTGGQQKITQSKATLAKIAAPGKTAEDYKGAIGVSGDNVEGAEITVPNLQFVLTARFPLASVTFGYLATLYHMTGTVNNAAWKGFAYGELLFLGASAQQRGVDDPDISFKFAGRANQTSVVVGDITVAYKYGWEYLWVRYEDAVDGTAKKVVKRPASVYVEQVYDYTDFSLLGLGV